MKTIEQCFPVVLFIMVALTFESVGEILKCDHSYESYWAVPVFCGTALYNVVLTFECVDETPKRSFSNESYWAVLSCDTVYYYAVQGGSN